jgi:hypothetical protein
MRFKLGLAVGFAAGYWYGSLSEEERKRQLDEALTRVRTNPRVQEVTDTVSRRTGKLGDAVSSRMGVTAETTDVASTAAPSGSGTGGSTSSRSKPTSSSSSGSSSSGPSDGSGSVADAEAARDLPGSGIG